MCIHYFKDRMADGLLFFIRDTLHNCIKMKTDIKTISIMAALIAVGCNPQTGGEDTAGQGDGLAAEEHHDETTLTRQQAEAAGLKTETVEPAPFRSVILTSGKIQAPQGDDWTVVATQSGTVRFTDTTITEGTPVRKGETLATVSARNLQDGDPVMKARIALDTAEKEFRRAERLVADKIVSEKDFEQARMRYETAKMAYEGLATGITDRGAAVTSPMTGYIRSLLVGQGEYVEVGQPIAVVTQTKRLWLRADVSEHDFKYLHSIQSANFKTAYDDKVYRLSDMDGRLVSYGRSSDSGASYIPVTFEFDGTGDIVPGSFAEVYLLSRKRDSVISVPVSALTEEQGVLFVYVQTEDRAFRKQEVTAGQSDGTRVEILKGVKKGDKVVTHGAYRVKLAAASTAIPEHNHSH